MKIRTHHNTSPFQDFQANFISGFLVFMVALPLSLGIAKASGFPASMGVLSAIIGGLVTTFFRVSPLSIKGPAAGLITISGAAILEFGGGEQGWKIAAAAIVISAVIQILFALARLGSLSDFFPHSAVHGMLAAIGIIIIAKQIPVLLGDDPQIYKGEGPLELLLDIPSFITHAHWHIAVVGLLGLAVMFVLPHVGIRFLKKIPAPLIVLLLTIPLSIYWHFKETEPAYSLVEIGNFLGSMGMNADFSWMGTVVFWKYVFMFLFVGTLESLLTVKAVDNLDPKKRVSSYNGDLMGVGVGNAIAGFLGGLPIISEVVRSSANIEFGATTKWSNFYHGLLLLLAMIFLIPYLELIPNASLAAMLIYAGFRLASPRNFKHAYQIGKEQLAIFLVTIVVTLAEDLLLGIAAGILVKFIFHLWNGASLKSFFRPYYSLEKDDNNYRLNVLESALFSNIIGFKKVLEEIPNGGRVRIDLSKTVLIDHSFMSFIHHFQNSYRFRGGEFEITGLKNHRSLSKDEMATKKLIRKPRKNEN